MLAGGLHSVLVPPEHVAEIVAALTQAGVQEIRIERRWANTPGRRKAP